MKKELLELYREFLEHIEIVNNRKEEMERIFEDDIEPTFANFMKWLYFNENK